MGHDGWEAIYYIMNVEKTCQKSGLVKHSKIHTGEKPRIYVRNVEKAFQENRTWLIISGITPWVTVTDEKPFMCHERGKCFSWQFSLVRHSRLQTGEKPYICHESGKCFPQKSSLVKHLRSHMVHMGKARFCYKSSLVRQFRIHSGWNHLCHEYGNVFSQIKQVGITFKDSQCRSYRYGCVKYFCLNDYLVSHSRICTGGKPYVNIIWLFDIIN